MAGKPTKAPKDNTELYDAGRRHVFAEKIQPLPDNLRKKISVILEAIPSKSKTEIAEVLQSCDYDVDKALDCFINRDGLMDNQNEWMVQGRRKNKNRNKPVKKPTKENNSTQGKSTNNKPSVVENKPSEKQEIGSQQTNGLLNCLHQTESTEALQQSEEKATTSDKDSSIIKPLTDGELKNEKTNLSVPSSPSSIQASRAELAKSPPESSGKGKHGHHTTHEKHPRIRTHSTSGNEVIKKSLKDLQRSSVSISRFQSMLDEDAEMSTKILAQSFQALRQALDDREKILEEQLNAVIEETRNLLQERQEDAAGLKFKCNRVGSMSEEEAIELRNEIKHFVAERRIDEDLGKTKRFLRDEGKMIEAIKNFGEVPPVKHHYTPYKKKNPEPVKPKPDEKKPLPLKVVPPENKAQEKHESQKGSRGRNSRYNHDHVFSPARLKDQAEMHARLQEVVKQQTGSLSVDTNKKTHSDEKPKSKDSTGSPTKFNNGKQATNGPHRHFTSQQNSKNSPRDVSKSQNTAENTSDKLIRDKTMENSASIDPMSMENKNPPGVDKAKNGVGSLQKTRRQYVRKTPLENGNTHMFTENHLLHDKKDGIDSEETDIKSNITNGDSLQKEGQNLIVNGADGPIPLRQRNRKARKVYHKKNPQTEFQFSVPKENASLNGPTNGKSTVE